MKTTILGAVQSILLLAGSIFGIPSVKMDDPTMQVVAQIAVVVYAVVVYFKSKATADAVPVVKE